MVRYGAGAELTRKTDAQVGLLTRIYINTGINVRVIEELGLHQVREPYIKPLRDKLWEMRIRGRDGIARAIYVTAKERRIVILQAFVKKTRKTPATAIRTALTRMRELEP